LFIIGLILLVFVLLVIYNKTVGYYVTTGWNSLRDMMKQKVDMDIAIDPGQTGEPAVTASLLPEPTPTPPEPVGISSSADGPPTDQMLIAPEDRPAGMPGSVSDTVAQSIVGSLESKLPAKKEVFNISRNIYTFHDAAAVCAAAGADLATYDQVKAAYEDGADWCNYGWTKGQMALYPTQKSTYEKLQKGAPEFQNACGKPGVNGGYFDNPELRFGVNCYGVKPVKKASDEVLDSQVALPMSPAELEFEKQVQKFRDQMDNATILPFHKGRWNE
jgi:hypothetical protein